MAGRLVWLPALWGLLFLAADAGEPSAQEPQATIPAPSAHCAAFAELNTIRLVLREQYDKQGETFDVSAREAVAEALAAAGLTLVADGPAEAELTIAVSARPLSTDDPSLGLVWDRGEASAEATLTLADLPPLTATWSETQQRPPAEARRVADSPAWPLAGKASARSFLCLLAALKAEAFPPLLRSASASLRGSAFAVAAVWQDPAVIPAVTEALADPDPFWRAGAAYVLSQCGPAAAPAIPALVQALGDAEPEARGFAAQALGAIGPGSAVAAPALLTAAKDPDSFVRTLAVQSLGQIGLPVELALPAFTEALSDSESSVKSVAAQGLGALGPAAGSAVPLLIPVLQDSHPAARAAAADALGEIGPAAASAAPALLAAFEDPSPMVRAVAAQAISRVQASGETVVPQLVRLLEDPAPLVRVAAVYSLRKMGKEAEAAIPSLEKLLEDAEPGVREAARGALAEIRGAP